MWNDWGFVLESILMGNKVEWEGGGGTNMIRL